MFAFFGECFDLDHLACCSTCEVSNVEEYDDAGYEEVVAESAGLIVAHLHALDFCDPGGEDGEGYEEG